MESINNFLESLKVKSIDKDYILDQKAFELKENKLTLFLNNYDYIKAYQIEIEQGTRGIWIDGEYGNMRLEEKKGHLTLLRLIKAINLLSDSELEEKEEYKNTTVEISER